MSDKKKEYDRLYYQKNTKIRYATNIDEISQRRAKNYRNMSEIQHERCILRNYIFQLSLNPNHTFQVGSISQLRDYTGLYSSKPVLDSKYKHQREVILNKYDMEQNKRDMEYPKLIDPVTKKIVKYSAVKLEAMKIDRFNKKLDEKAAAFKAKLDSGFIMEISNI